jgi:outer membrane protein insertion porin family
LGNESISTNALEGVLLTTTGGLLAKGWYQEAVFEEDLLAIKALYEQQGYLGAKIVSVEKAFSPDQTLVSLTITIEEGVQTRITEVRILGENDEDRLKRLQRLNVLKEGDPLTIRNINTTVSQMRNYYNNLGYLNANIDVSTAFNQDNSQVIVTIQLSAGQQFFVGDISIQGVVKTNKDFIRREILVEKGDVYNPQKIRDTVRRLHQLGLYDSVRFQRLNTKSNEPEQDMVLLVSETSAKDVEFGIGYSTELGGRGFVEYSDRNVFNYGGKGSARTELSLERPKVTLQYLHPHVFTRDTKLAASLFDEFQRDNPSFEVEKRGGRLAVHHTFDPTLSLSVGYLFQQVDPSDVNKAAQISPYDTDVLNLGGLDAQVLWDFRDDIIQPRKGGVNQLYLRMTSKALGAEAEFFEAQAQSNWYWRVIGDMVVACALSGKLIEPADGSKQVPIYARYFLGGDSTVRGFEKYEIGPSAFTEDGDAVRVGGNRLVRGNVEIRFPIYGSFGGVLFGDAGANWINEDGFNSTYIREGAGVGLRVATPIGPLRLDYGWKLDREEGESAGEFYLTIGSAF